MGQGSAVEAVPGLSRELAEHRDTEKLSQRDTENRIHLWLCPERKQDDAKDTQAPFPCPQAVFVWLDCFQLAEWGQALCKSCH